MARGGLAIIHGIADGVSGPGRVVKARGSIIGGVSQPFASAMRKPKEVITVITPWQKSEASKVESDSTLKAE